MTAVSLHRIELVEFYGRIQHFNKVWGFVYNGNNEGPILVGPFSAYPDALAGTIKYCKDRAIEIDKVPKISECFTCKSQMINYECSNHCENPMDKCFADLHNAAEKQLLEIERRNSKNDGKSNA